jgi:predicted Rossmann-fold nucleotide-binding protein
VRKVMLVNILKPLSSCRAAFGTLDEVFETITLMQTSKLGYFPIIAMGGNFWKKLGEFIQSTLVYGRNGHALQTWSLFTQRILWIGL